MSFGLLVESQGSLSRECSLGYKCLLFQLTFSLAFFGAFCFLELVVSSCQQVGGLLQDDVQFLPTLVWC